MSSRFTSLTGLILAFSFIQGCSSPESKERLKTALCWLRPSCLPSQPQKAKAPTTPAASKPSPAQQKAKVTQHPPLAKTPTKLAASKPSPAPQKAKATQRIPPKKRPTKPCVASARATIHASEPSVKVTYREPTTKANGKPLDNLEKTTIYYDLGDGKLIKHGDFLASKPQGRGMVPKDTPASKPQGRGTVPMKPKEYEKVPIPVSPGPTIQAMICI